MQSLIIFALGLSVGSFLNVLIYRLPRGEKFVKGRSRCPSCRHILDWKDLIPLFSFIALKRKCRYCAKKISWRYFWIELLAGSIFLALFLLNDSLFSWSFIFSAATAGLLIVLIFIDFDYLMIPDKILAGLGLLGFGNLLFLDRTLIFNNFLTGLVNGLIFFLIYSLANIRYKGGGMGFGDVKLAALLGFLFGFPAILPIIYLALAGSLTAGLVLILFFKKELQTKLPFGSFLGGAAIIYILFNQFFIPALTPYFFRFYL